MNKTFVFDTNVLLSAALNPRLASHTAFLIALRKGYIVSSEQTLAELKDKIYMSKFDKYAPLPRRENFY
jgi:predicted nucleic acid-binding protein